LVHRFYRRAIPDPLLGPVFEGFGVDWPRHLPKLVAYWEHVLLDHPGIATNTVGVHGRVQNVAPFGQNPSIGGWSSGSGPSTSCTPARSPTSRKRAPARSGARSEPSRAPASVTPPPVDILTPRALAPKRGLRALHRGGVDVPPWVNSAGDRRRPTRWRDARSVASSMRSIAVERV